MDMPPWPPWTPGETLADQGGQVWVVAVDLTGDADGGLLDEDERARAARFQAAHHARRFIAAHAGLRRVLGDCVQRPAGRLRFSYGPQGKPELMDAAGWRFNLSHSGDLALIAVTRWRSIGVDLEQHRPGVAMRELARRFFAAEEAQALEALPEEQREAAFFACWSRKEAVVKALGTGLATPLECFRVEVDPRREAQVLAQPPAWPAWTLAHLELPAGWSGTVAVEGPGWPLARRRLAAPSQH